MTLEPLNTREGVIAVLEHKTPDRIESPEDLASYSPPNEQLEL